MLVGHVSSPNPTTDPLLVARRALVSQRERALRSSGGWAALAGALLLLGMIVSEEGFAPLASFLLGVSSAGLLAGSLDAIHYLRLARTLRHLRPKEPRT